MSTRYALVQTLPTGGTTVLRRFDSLIEAMEFCSEVADHLAGNGVSPERSSVYVEEIASN